MGLKSLNEFVLFSWNTLSCGDFLESRVPALCWFFLCPIEFLAWIWVSWVLNSLPGLGSESKTRSPEERFLDASRWVLFLFPGTQTWGWGGGTLKTKQTVQWCHFRAVFHLPGDNGICSKGTEWEIELICLKFKPKIQGCVSLKKTSSSNPNSQGNYLYQDEMNLSIELDGICLRKEPAPLLDVSLTLNCRLKLVGWLQNRGIMVLTLPKGHFNSP